MALFGRSSGTTVFRTVLTRKTLREIHKNAKATASSNWLPTSTQPEPHWVEEWDGQIEAGIAETIARFELDTVAVLQIIAQFNDAPGATRPRTLERTAECRRAHRQWAAYAEVRRSAVQALVLYDQRRESMLRDVQAHVDLNHAGRGVFYAKLAEYHPRPSEVRNLDVTPLSMDSDFGARPMSVLHRAQQIVDTAREKLRREATKSPAPGPPADGLRPDPGPYPGPPPPSREHPRAVE